MDALALNVNQAAHALQVHRHTLMSLIVSGQIRAVKLGRQWRIHRAEIERVLVSGPDSGKLPTGGKTTRQRRTLKKT